MDITVGKVLSMVLFLVSLSLSSILPLILARRKNRQSSQGATAGKSQGQHIINACNSVAGRFYTTFIFFLLWRGCQYVGFAKIGPGKNNDTIKNIVELIQCRPRMTARRNCFAIDRLLV